MSRVFLMCSCGASIDASWDTSVSYRIERTPPQLDQFRRDHRPCTKPAASRPREGDERLPTIEEVTGILKPETNA